MLDLSLPQCSLSPAIVYFLCLPPLARALSQVLKELRNVHPDGKEEAKELLAAQVCRQ